MKQLWYPENETKLKESISRHPRSTWTGLLFEEVQSRTTRKLWKTNWAPAFSHLTFHKGIYLLLTIEKSNIIDGRGEAKVG
jgi:hypothetical protein